MKKRIYQLALAFLVTSAIAFQSMEGMMSWFKHDDVKEAVDKIKQKSDLTEADLNKWFSLVRFGRSWIGRKGAALINPAMVAAAYTGAAYLNPRLIPDFLKRAWQLLPASISGATGLANVITTTNTNTEVVNNVKQVTEIAAEMAAEVAAVTVSEVGVATTVAAEIADKVVAEAASTVNYFGSQNTTIAEVVSSKELNGVVGKLLPTDIGSLATKALFGTSALIALYASYKFWYARTEQAMIEKLYRYEKFMRDDAKELLYNLEGIRGLLMGSNRSDLAFDAVLTNLQNQTHVAREMLQLINLEYHATLKYLNDKIEDYSTKLSSLRSEIEKHVAEIQYKKSQLELQEIEAKNRLLEAKKKATELEYEQSLRKKAFDAASSVSGALVRGVKTGWSGIKEIGHAIRETSKFVNRHAFTTIGVATVGYFVIKGGNLVWEQYVIGK